MNISFFLKNLELVTGRERVLVVEGRRAKDSFIVNGETISVKDMLGNAADQLPLVHVSTLDVEKTCT